AAVDQLSLVDRPMPLHLREIVCQEAVSVLVAQGSKGARIKRLLAAPRGQVAAVEQRREAHRRRVLWSGRARSMDHLHDLLLDLFRPGSGKTVINLSDGPLVTSFT